jgi:hypothetical protein
VIILLSMDIHPFCDNSGNNLSLEKERLLDDLSSDCSLNILKRNCLLKNVWIAVYIE